MPETDLALLAEAARAAGEIAKRHFGQGPETWDKGDGQGPVTEADLEVDRMLHAELTTARPDYAWLSEETPDHPARLSHDRVFVVDPIDGTRAFIDGEKNWSHSLAIVENGVPIAAAIYVPMRDILYLAVRGQGATRNGEPITHSDRAALQDATVLGTKANFKEDRWTGGRPPVTQRFVSSLAYRLALAAEGRYDAMITLRAAWEWDIAAGALMVTEAGGLAKDRRAAALRFNNPQPQVDGVLAGAPAITRALLERLAPAR
ncbi:MAG: 3'(2'),5'-bisphosphate nucleotidase CysQ [Pseudomonadota bacterium]